MNDAFVVSLCSSFFVYVFSLIIRVLIRFVIHITIVNLKSAFIQGKSDRS